MILFRTYIVLFFGFLQITAITAQESHSMDELAGTYKNPDYSFFEKVYYNLFQRTSFIGKTTLELKKDSSFLFMNCYIGTGDWSVKGDSLILQYMTMNWRNDSARIHGYNGFWPSPPSYPIKYKIDGDMLRLRTTLKIEDRKLRGIEDLERVSTKDK